MNTIVFVGAGSMAEAIIAGIVQQHVLAAHQIYVMNKSDDERLLQLQQKYGISIVTEKTILQQADLVILATKPKDIKQALQDIAPFINEKAAILSVVAGVSIATIEKHIGKHPIARSMPNTSAMIGLSATGIAFNQVMPEKMKQHIHRLLSSIGIAKEVVEDDLHAVTAVSGSGPAYVYFLVEAMEEAALAQGLSKEVARDFIIQTIEGAANMLRVTKEEPHLLRHQVTSPNGTTEAGIKVLEQQHFKSIIQSCIQHAAERSRELGRESMKNSVK